MAASDSKQQNENKNEEENCTEYCSYIQFTKKKGMLCQMVF